MEIAAGVTAAMLDCISTTFERAEGALNALWDKQLPQVDPELADMLRKAQRDWIDYRDTTCAAEGAVWGGGSFAAVALSDCRLRLTQERLGWLEKISRPER
ncbi:DUF1311 domain-containing protein [Aquamicrobium lusatiense]|uniref:lysozyme inhibitor LprI family protein n=1 Tax=Aquamicrobium lusatiense TaxID=89772 RepID=UPI002458F595|nr:DUF1311 domain-containing protein [Aquamicrobium lusatiense]MDH4992359.1 DUF1311 domain-containing protein [Aquamicrobium lusatiense]